MHDEGILTIHLVLRSTHEARRPCRTLAVASCLLNQGTRSRQAHLTPSNPLSDLLPAGGPQAIRAQAQGHSRPRHYLLDCPRDAVFSAPIPCGSPLPGLAPLNSIWLRHPSARLVYVAEVSPYIRFADRRLCKAAPSLFVNAIFRGARRDEGGHVIPCTSRRSVFRACPRSQEWLPSTVRQLPSFPCG
ncbi:hypothetical protein K466DRAFT_91186 [Polyporus arcularius HHB13444]|uniref:Uncharacterized protein n=1 Tax=Polyporus arcularius HHB13444 TaxID=1314778 RepID=A0A5C3NPM0_9APHY|nr:hypothetical protein K466DRAFT_91186 [Polyporus arcularius HHB13444]